MFREKATSTLVVFIQVLSPGRFGIWSVVRNKKSENPQKPHMTPGEIEPWSLWWEERALATAPSLLPPSLQSVPMSDFTTRL